MTLYWTMQAFMHTSSGQHRRADLWPNIPRREDDITDADSQKPMMDQGKWILKL